MATDEKTPEEIAAEKAAADKAAADAAANKDDSDDSDDDAFDKERAMATIRKQREEAKELRAKAREVEELRTKLQAIEDAEKTDLEKAQTRIAELEASQAAAAAATKETLLKLAVFSKSAELGIVDPEIALALLDRSAVEYDDNGDPSNVKEQLKALLEAKPLLAGTPGKPKPPATNAGAGGGETPPPALTAAELEWAEKTGMTAEEYALYKTGDSMTLADAHKVRERVAAAQSK